MHGLGDSRSLKESGVGQMAAPGHGGTGNLENLIMMGDMKILLKSTFTQLVFGMMIQMLSLEKELFVNIILKVH